MKVTSLTNTSANLYFLLHLYHLEFILIRGDNGSQPRTNSDKYLNNKKASVFMSPNLAPHSIHINGMEELAKSREASRETARETENLCQRSVCGVRRRRRCSVTKKEFLKND